jgi:putative transposase
MPRSTAISNLKSQISNLTAPPSGWIPAAEAATILKVAARTIRNRILGGDLAGGLCVAPSGQKAYYVDPAADETLAALYLPRETQPHQWRGLVGLSGAKRRRAALRLLTLEAWDKARAGLPAGANIQTEYRSWIAANYKQLGLADPPSWATLWRWSQASRRGGLVELAPQNWGRAAAEPSPSAWAFFQTLYLDENRRTIKDCWRQTRAASAERRWAWLSYAQCAAKVDRDIPAATQIRYREGRTALENKAVPYIERDYDSIESNAWWVVDHHQLDVAAIGPGGQPIFAWITLWQDVRSRKVMGKMMHAGPNLDVVLASLRRAMLHYGVPQHILFDNGKEFRSRAFSGGPARMHKYEVDSVRVRASLSHLPVSVHFAEPFNAKSKPNERLFLTMRKQFSQQWATYRGNDPKRNRPEALAKILKEYETDNIIPTMEVLAAALDFWVEDVYDKTPHRGRGMNGRTPLECYEQELKEIVRVQEGELALLMMRTTEPRVVGRNGVSLWGRNYHSPELFGFLGKKVYARFDPQETGRVYLFDLQDRFVAVAERKDLMAWGATHDDIKQAKRAKAHYRRMARAYAEQSDLVNKGDVLQNVSLQRQAAEAERAERNPSPDPPDGEKRPKVIAFRSVLAETHEALQTRLPAAAGGPEPSRRRRVLEDFRTAPSPEVRIPHAAAKPDAEGIWSEIEVHDKASLLKKNKTPKGA